MPGAPLVCPPGTCWQGGRDSNGPWARGVLATPTSPLFAHFKKTEVTVNWFRQRFAKPAGCERKKGKLPQKGSCWKQNYLGQAGRLHTITHGATPPPPPPPPRAVPIAAATTFGPSTRGRPFMPPTPSWGARARKNPEEELKGAAPLGVSAVRGH